MKCSGYGFSFEEDVCTCNVESLTTLVDGVCECVLNAVVNSAKGKSDNVFLEIRSLVL